MIPAKLKSEDGYTLIEVLVAINVLFIVLIAATQIVSYLLSSQKNYHEINAINLAEKEMALCIVQQNFNDEEHTESVGGKDYLITRSVSQQDHLALITIQVRRPGKTDPVVQLYKFHLPDDN